MNPTRRSFLTACLAVAAAPAIIRASSLMPVRSGPRLISIIDPKWERMAGDLQAALFYGDGSPLVRLGLSALTPPEREWFKLGLPTTTS